jgi:transglutaminase-like putative cysteine protease
MLRSLLPVVVLLFLVPRLAPAHPGEVLFTAPAPGAFCTGMTFDGEHLWVADHEADRLFALDTATGEVVRSIPSPGFWPMGLAWDGAHLWNVDRKQAKIFQVDPTSGRILRVIEAPSSDPEGLAWDGTTLWVGDSRTKKIMRLDLSDGTAVQTVTAPSGAVNGLTFDGRYLWCSDRVKDELTMIVPESGEVIVVLASPGPYPRGLAWDGEFLWNVDWEGDRVHRIVRRDDETFRLYDPRRAVITFTHEVKVTGTGSLRSLDTFLALPREMPQQSISAIRLQPEEHRVERDRWEQPVAVFSYRDLPSESTTRSVMKVTAEISAIDYYLFPDHCGTLDDIPADIRARYTADGTKYRTEDPRIRDLAAQIVGEETNPYLMARRVFDHVGETLEYKLEGGWNAAPVVLERGTGSCSEYSFCFIALCRAAGVPARYAGAIVVRGDDASLDEVFHRWPEIYLPGYGWVPIDPQAGDKKSPRDRAMSIGHLSNRFLITTLGGGDSEYLGWYYNYHEAFETDPQVQVHIETFGTWEPRD